MPRLYGKIALLAQGPNYIVAQKPILCCTIHILSLAFEGGRVLTLFEELSFMFISEEGFCGSLDGPR